MFQGLEYLVVLLIKDRIINKCRGIFYSFNTSGRATLQEWALIFYGTDSPPPGYKWRVTAKPDLPQPTVSTAPPQQTKKNKPRKNNKLMKAKKTQQAKARKTPRPSVIQARRPVVTTAAPTQPPVGLTILLAPPPQPHTNSFPAVFQRYSKVQQLYPYSSIHQPPPRPRKTNNQSQGKNKITPCNPVVLLF